MSRPCHDAPVLEVFKIGSEAMGGVLEKEMRASGRRELSLVGEHAYKAMMLCLPAALVPPEGDPVPLERLSLGSQQVSKGSQLDVRLLVVVVHLQLVRIGKAAR